MEEDNIAQKNLKISANHKASSCKLQPGILYNKMEWLKGKLDNNEHGKNPSQREMSIKSILG